MKKVKDQPYLYISKDCFYFRAAVPSRLIKFVDKAEYKKSLKTKDLKIARIKCAKMSVVINAFFIELKKLTIRLDNDLATKLAKNHFEKRLLDASEEFYFETRLALDDPKNEGVLLVHKLREDSERNYKRYENLRINFEYTDEQEFTAKELLRHEGCDLDTLDTASLRDLCLKLVIACHEAERINLAYLQNQAGNGIIREPLFTDCTNFFEKPSPDLYFQNLNKGYWEDKNKADEKIDLQTAVDQFFVRKKLEAEGKKRKEGYWKRYSPYFDELIEILGADFEISSLKKADASMLKNYYLAFPANYKLVSKKLGMSLQELLTSKEADYEYMKANTAKMRWQAFIEFFKWGREVGYVTENPFLEIEFKGKRHSQDDKDPFSTEQLRAIFKSPIYTGRKYSKISMWVPAGVKDERLIIKDGYYWLPLIALFTGLRSGEILLLKTENFKFEKSIYYIDLFRKQYKTINALRKVPIHDELIKMGLIEYIKKRTALVSSNDPWLFNNIPMPNLDRPSNKYSNKFSDYLKGIHQKTESTSFHSFRHNFEDAMVDADISERTQIALIGHTAGGGGAQTNYKYGSTKLKNLHRDINKIKYDVDFSHLYKS